MIHRASPNQDIYFSPRYPDRYRHLKRTSQLLGQCHYLRGSGKWCVMQVALQNGCVALGGTGVIIK